MTLCTVCAHPELEAIDLALRGGESTREVGRRFKIAKSNVIRHRARCIVLQDLRTTNAARRLAGEPQDKPMAMSEVLLKASAAARMLDDELVISERLGKAPPLSILRELRQSLRDLVEMSVLAKRVAGDGPDGGLQILMPEAFMKAVAPPPHAALPAPIPALPAPETPTPIPEPASPPTQAQTVLSDSEVWKRRTQTDLERWQRQSLRDAEEDDDSGRTPARHPAFQIPNLRR